MIVGCSARPPPICLAVAADLGVDPVVVEVFRLKIFPAVDRRVPWRGCATEACVSLSLRSSWQVKSTVLANSSGTNVS